MKTFNEAVAAICFLEKVQDGESIEDAAARILARRKEEVDNGRAVRFDALIEEAVHHYTVDVLAMQLAEQVLNDKLTGTDAMKLAFAQGVCVGIEMEKAEDPIL